ITGASGLTHTGAIQLMRSMSGTLRRISGSTARVTDAALKTWTDIANKTFVRPGTALIPGVTTEVFYDDFEVNSLQTIASRAFPYASQVTMLTAYNDAADTGQIKKWKPRDNTHTSNSHGNADKQQNQELQEFLDPSSGNGITTHEWAITLN